LGAEIDDMLSDYGLDSDFGASDPEVGSEEWMQRNENDVDAEAWRRRVAPYMK
jgi:hypothetical protein